MSTNLTDLISLAWLERLLSIALNKQGDFAEVYVERSLLTSVALEEQQIKSVASELRLGLGIRVVAAGRVGYAYANDLRWRALEKTALTAAAIAETGVSSGTRGGGRKEQGPRVKIQQSPNFSSSSRAPSELSSPTDLAISEKAALLRRGATAAYGVDPQIVYVIGSLVEHTKEILIANSLGQCVSDRQLMCRLNFTTMAIAREDARQRYTGAYGRGGRVTARDYYQQYPPESIAKEAARIALSQLGAKPAPVGPQTVVLAPGWSGMFIHEAVGHGLEADFIRQGTSLYSGRLGEQVASSACTLVDNGCLPGFRGTTTIDDEGTTPQETVLLEKGRLRGFMVDQLSSKLMKLAVTGNGRRESYQHPPLPRMTNTYLLPGPYEPEEITKSVKRGIYCATLGGGEVDITNGNFVFTVKEGYLIEEGRLTAPLKNATLVGVGPKILNKVVMVGNDLLHDPGIGTCTKDGQNVPVGVGLPTIRLDDLTVGGTDVDHQ